MKRVWLLLAVVPVGHSASGPVTITSFDMFNEAGQFYRVYAADGNSSVSGRLGVPSADQQV